MRTSSETLPRANRNKKETSPGLDGLKTGSGNEEEQVWVYVEEEAASAHRYIAVVARAGTTAEPC